MRAAAGRGDEERVVPRDGGFAGAHALVDEIAGVRATIIDGMRELGYELRV